MTPESFKLVLGGFNGNPPAPSSAIQDAEERLKMKLPHDYVEFLNFANGGEGDVGSAYMILWRVEELAELNLAYEVTEYAPGLLVFGSDGGGEAFAFDTRADGSPVVCVPFVGMDPTTVHRLADSFREFLLEDRFGRFLDEP